MLSSSFTTRFLWFVLLTSIAVVGYLTFFKRIEVPKYVLIRDKKIFVELAHSDEEVKMGLSFRTKLNENSGMYFVFDTREKRTFWMNEMKFPLDIIWIDSGKTIGIEKNAPIPTIGYSVPTFTSPGPVTAVLEVNAGFSDKNSLELNDSVKLINE